MQNCNVDWLHSCSIKIEDVNDIVIGKLDIEEETLLINHIIILGKYLLYRNSLNGSLPHFEVFKLRIKYVYNIEKGIATKNDKMSLHLLKWNKLLNMF